MFSLKSDAPGNPDVTSSNMHTAQSIIIEVGNSHIHCCDTVGNRHERGPFIGLLGQICPNTRKKDYVTLGVKYSPSFKVILNNLACHDKKVFHFQKILVLF